MIKLTGFQLFWVYRDGCHMLMLSGTPDFTPFGEFMILLLNIYIVYYWICQFNDYVYWLMTDLFAWISLAALSRTYFIIKVCIKHMWIVGYYLSRPLTLDDLFMSIYLIHWASLHDQST